MAAVLDLVARYRRISLISVKASRLLPSTPIRVDHSGARLEHVLSLSARQAELVDDLGHTLPLGPSFE